MHTKSFQNYDYNPPLYRLCNVHKGYVLYRALGINVFNSLQEEEDFEQQSFNLKEGSDFISATTDWQLQKVHEVLTGEGVVIAILDTGIDTNHEAFKDKFDSNQMKEINFMDDNVLAYSKPESHGTMAAFVAGGKEFKVKKNEKGEEIKPNGIDIASGVAPNAKLIICRVGTKLYPESTKLKFDPKDIIKALKYLIDQKEEERSKTPENGVLMLSPCRLG